MAWIEYIPFEQATGKLLKLYKRVTGPDNNVDNIMLVHSLRPHSMEGHMALYKNVLHHSSNAIDKWFLEALGVYTSMLNSCEYCVEHHYAGMARLLGDTSRSEVIRQALESGGFEAAFNAQQCAAFHYARKLTTSPATVSKADVQALRTEGWDDGEILEINQVVAYFGYANRTALGLGVYTAGDILGLSPNNSDEPDNWQHT